VELDVFRCQTVRADDDVDLSRLEASDGGALFFGRAKTAELGDVEGELGHPLAKAVEVLLGEDGCGDENGDLVAAVNGLKGGSHGDLGFAEANVAAEQAIHGSRAEHVGFDGSDRGKLVGCFSIREGGVEFALPLAISIERDAGPGSPEGLHFQHFDGQIDDGAFGLLLLAKPGFAADFGECGAAFCATDVFLDEIDLDRGDENLGAGVKLDLQVLFLLSLLVDEPQAAVAADAVGQVDDEVAFAKVEERIDRLAESSAGQAAQFGAMEELAGGE
jgi:hypothetical protein